MCIRDSSISDSTSIVVLSDTSKVKLPSNYQEAKLTLNDKEFPVWQNSDSTDYYVLYAMNNKGETGYYQYDSQENTYQRMDDPSETSKTCLLYTSAGKTGNCETQQSEEDEDLQCVLRKSCIQRLHTDGLCESFDADK